MDLGQCVQYSPHVWTSSLAPSSTDLQEDFLLEPSSSTTAPFLPKLHFLSISFPPFLFLQQHSLIEMPWKANHQDDLFHLMDLAFGHLIQTLPN
jgi:hypothetical protein